jgi:hypothetical protein
MAITSLTMGTTAPTGGIATITMVFTAPTTITTITATFGIGAVGADATLSLLSLMPGVAATPAFVRSSRVDGVRVALPVGEDRGLIPARFAVAFISS